MTNLERQLDAALDRDLARESAREDEATARHIMREMIAEADKCPRCDGTGLSPRLNTAGQPCALCAGSGTMAGALAVFNALSDGPHDFEDEADCLDGWTHEAQYARSVQEGAARHDQLP